MSAATITPTKPARAARKAGGLCVVHLGVHFSAAMPIESGVQLMRIMASAKMVERDFGSHSRDRYVEREQAGATEMILVAADQVTPMRSTKPALKEIGVTP